MCLDDNAIRELTQLWYVAGVYLGLAGDLKPLIFDVTIKELTERCKTLDALESDRSASDTVMFTAHLSSAAGRLCSIDERIEKLGNAGAVVPNSRRKSKYNELFRHSIKATLEGKNNKISEARGEIKKALPQTVHFILRNRSVHAEYPNEEAVYGLLKVLALYDAMRKVEESIKKDLVEMKVIPA